MPIKNVSELNKMNKVVHFEIPTDDMARAKKFYQDTFGWLLEDQPGMEYVIARTVEVDDKMMPKEPGGINGGMAKRGENLKAPSLAINVDNIDEAMQNVKKSGGVLATEKMPVGKMGFMAYFRDTEGNVLSLWQSTM